ncbi:hypothetical protein HZS_4890 [Henneguya salminicola]|nr:hypothetical protein HZS_4890 [Henneguya salminicola]
MLIYIHQAALYTINLLLYGLSLCKFEWYIDKKIALAYSSTLFSGCYNLLSVEKCLDVYVSYILSGVLLLVAAIMSFTSFRRRITSAHILIQLISGSVFYHIYSVILMVGSVSTYVVMINSPNSYKFSVPVEFSQKFFNEMPQKMYQHMGKGLFFGFLSSFNAFIILCILIGLYSNY